MEEALQYPQHVYWFVPVVLIAALTIWYLVWKRNQLKRLADAHLISGLLQNSSRKAISAKHYLAIPAALLLAICMLNPQTPSERAPIAATGTDVMLLFDVSQSMLADDVQPSRLEYAKKLGGMLLDTLKGGRAGLIPFAGEARLEAPLTDDMVAVHDLLNFLNTESVPLDGSNLEDALHIAAESLGTTETQHKAVVLLTDGEALQGDVESATELQKMGSLLLIVPIGTEQGTQLTDRDGNAMYAPTGERVVSKVNTELLQDLATRYNGQLVAAPDMEAQVAALAGAIKQLPSRPVANTYLTNFFSYSHYLFPIVILLLLVSMLLSETKSTAKLATVVCLLLSTRVSAQSADELYSRGMLKEAEVQYQNMASASSSANQWRAHLQLGNIALKSGDPERSMAHYEQASQLAPSAADLGLVVNNIGLNLAKQQRLEEAVSMLKYAVKLRPNDEEIVQNLRQALADLEQQKKQPPKKQAQQPKQLNNLKALRQEEQRIRQNLRNRVPRNNDGKNW